MEPWNLPARVRPHTITSDSDSDMGEPFPRTSLPPSRRERRSPGLIRGRYTPRSLVPGSPLTGNLHENCQRRYLEMMGGRGCSEWQKLTAGRRRYQGSCQDMPHGNLGGLGVLQEIIILALSMVDPT